MATSVDLTKNKMWVNRMGEYFDSVDLNKNGYLTLDEILQWAANMRVMCKATNLEMTNLRIQLRQFWGAIGLRPGVQMTKQAFVQGVNRLAREELERKRRGQKTLHEQVNNAFFDVMDINNDGTVTLDELKVMMKACDMDPSGADGWFDAADTNKNGKIERQELNMCEFDFWFRPELEENSEMFGGAYSGRQGFV
ncbi:hypothetical protein OS493_014885 [Desmophyllum pertusum]|uniref:EF-hand domain-containing protein n=1 Tax=Desmophyllum pertusum TaxID=174260 RepID=A0A9W9YGU1_9CNID|nr:hypothetical protein OS493_014885 [Desmophyllum pertusum]